MDFDTLVDITWDRWQTITLELYGDGASMAQMIAVAQDAARSVAWEADLPILAVALYAELKVILVRAAKTGELVVGDRIWPTVLH